MKLWLIVLCMLFSWSLSAVAEEASTGPKIDLPEHYPDTFSNRGIVEAVGPVDGTTAITIGGVRYKLAPGVMIHLLSERYGSLSTLKPGMGVGFRLSEGGNDRRIAEMWELPAALTPPPS